MKIKKRFCAQRNGLVNAPKKSKFGLAAAVLRPLKKLKASGITAMMQQTSPPSTASKCFCTGSFHKSIYPVVALAQFFGVMPLHNIGASCPKSVKYTRRSFRFAFSVFVMLSCGFEAISAVIWTFKTHIEFGKMVILVYYVTNALSFLCFLRLAKTWPFLMKMWHDVENSLPNGGNEEAKRAMCKRIRKTAAIILLLSATEHILSIMSSVILVTDCPNIKSILKAYYVHNFPQVFSFVKYSHFLGFYVKFVHITSTFVWSYTDLFIMMISCGLSAMFKQINDRMQRDKGKVSACKLEATTQKCLLLCNSQFMLPEYWNEQRQYYRSVCDLVAFVDENISFITILSISNNLFFICVQLLNSVE